MRSFALILAATLIAFFLMHLSPYDPVQQYLFRNGTMVSEQQQEAIAGYWGRGQPFYVQYSQWALHALRGDFGLSLTYRQPVGVVIAERFRNTCLLMAAAWILSGGIGYVLGSVMGYYRGRLIDGFLRKFFLLIAATPTAWLGLLFLSFFAVRLGWFPIGFSTPIGVPLEDVSWQQRLYHLALPAITLIVISLPAVALHTQRKYAEVLTSDPVLFARARGKSGWCLFKDHILKHTVLPAVVLGFSDFAELFGGSVVAENVFSYPGLGSALTAAGLNTDLPLLLGITTVSSLFVCVGNVTSDLIQSWIDVRTGKDMLHV